MVDSGSWSRLLFSTKTGKTGKPVGRKAQLEVRRVSESERMNESNHRSRKNDLYETSFKSTM